MKRQDRVKFLRGQLRRLKHSLRDTGTGELSDLRRIYDSRLSDADVRRALTKDLKDINDHDAANK